VCVGGGHQAQGDHEPFLNSSSAAASAINNQGMRVQLNDGATKSKGANAVQEQKKNTE